MRVSLAFFHPCHLASHPLTHYVATCALPSFLALRSFVSASVLPSPASLSLSLPLPSCYL